MELLGANSDFRVLRASSRRSSRGFVVHLKRSKLKREKLNCLTKFVYQPWTEHEFVSFSIVRSLYLILCSCVLLYSFLIFTLYILFLFSLCLFLSLSDSFVSSLFRSDRRMCGDIRPRLCLSRRIEQARETQALQLFWRTLKTPINFMTFLKKWLCEIGLY